MHIDDLSEKLCDLKSSTDVFWSAYKNCLTIKSRLIFHHFSKTILLSLVFLKNLLFSTPILLLSVVHWTTIAFYHHLHSILFTVYHGLIFRIDAISKVISKLNVNKAHGVDEVSVAMLKQLQIIFDRCMSEGKFPSSWKLANVQPVHKKSSRLL